MATLQPGGPRGRRAKPESFELLCDRHRPHLERAAVAMTSDPDDAADLVQETLIRAYRYFHNYEPGSNFRAWALRILHNTHISRYRRNRRWHTEVAWDDVAEHGEARVEEAPGEAPPEPEEVVLGGVPDEVVQGALDSLPENFRVVVEMADLRDYSYAEIGRQLHLPIGTVRSRLFRARERLRRVLGPYAVSQGLVRPEDVETALPSAA